MRMPQPSVLLVPKGTFKPNLQVPRARPVKPVFIPAKRDARDTVTTEYAKRDTIALPDPQQAKANMGHLIDIVWITAM